jgi:hypothetical protein
LAALPEKLKPIMANELGFFAAQEHGRQRRRKRERVEGRDGDGEGDGQRELR